MEKPGAADAPPVGGQLRWLRGGRRRVGRPTDGPEERSDDQWADGAPPATGSATGRSSEPDEGTWRPKTSGALLWRTRCPDRVRVAGRRARGSRTGETSSSAAACRWTT